MLRKERRKGEFGIDDQVRAGGGGLFEGVESTPEALRVVLRRAKLDESDFHEANRLRET